MTEMLAEVRAALWTVWNRRWLALGVAWGVCVLGWLVVALIPNTYQSEARIFVQLDDMLAEYYQATHGAALFDRRLRKRVVFSDHSLATDSVFAEVQLVSCRNVLIYFDKALQERALGLFTDALCRRGYLGLGARETLRFSEHAALFSEVAPDVRIYQRGH